MSKAPNQTDDQYRRQQELYAIQKERGLSLPELYELRELCKGAISHLRIVTPGK